MITVISAEVEWGNLCKHDIIVTLSNQVTDVRTHVCSHNTGIFLKYDCPVDLKKKKREKTIRKKVKIVLQL